MPAMNPAQPLNITVAPEVHDLAPGFVPLVVEARGLTNGPSDERGSALLDDGARVTVRAAD